MTTERVERTISYNVPAKAVANIKWLSSVLRGFQSLADELGEAADVQQFIGMKRQELENLEHEYKALSEKFAIEVKEAEASKDAKIKAATKKADAILAEAAQQKQNADDIHEKAKEIRSGAQVKVDALIAEAKAGAKKLENDAAEKIMFLNKNIEKLASQEAKLLLDVSAAQKRLDTIVGKIAELKSKF